MGIVDYKEADILDRRWWNRWRLLVTELANQEDIKVLSEVLKFHLACVSNSGLTEDSFTNAQKSAREVYEEIQGLYRPWATASSKVKAISEDESWKSAWKHFFGWEMGDKEGLRKWREDRKKRQEKYAEQEAAEAQAIIDRQAEIVRRRQAVAERRRATAARRKT